MGEADKREMNKLTASYQIFLPRDITARTKILEFEPLKFTRDFGDFTMYVRTSKYQGTGQIMSLILHVDVKSDIKLDADEHEFINQLDAEVKQLAYRFLRLLRRKLPEMPFNLPADLLSSVSYNREKQQPHSHWQILASAEVLVEPVPQDAGITTDKWRELERELASGKDTEIWEDFLLDAKVALKESDLHRAMLYTAIACETFIKQYTQIAATKQGISKVFWDYINSRETDIRAIRYFGPILHLVTGRSLEDEENELYKSLERIFQKRNKIMHEGKRSFSANEVYRLRNDIQAGEQAISWVRNLQ